MSLGVEYSGSVEFKFEVGVSTSCTLQAYASVRFILTLSESALQEDLKRF
jgi:hypothetical protein